MKANNDKLPNKFDDSLVSTQLNAIGVAPIVNLMHHGYASTLSYDEISSKLHPHISNKAKFYISDLSQDLLHSMQCNKNAFKLGRTQVFFRPESKQFADIFLKLDNDETKKIAQQICYKFYIRQRRSLWIKLLFIDKSKFLTILVLTS